MSWSHPVAHPVGSHEQALPFTTTPAIILEAHYIFRELVTKITDVCL